MDNEILTHNKESLNNPILIIDETIKSILIETAKWGRFLSIVGFVFCGIIALIALFIIFAGNSFFDGIGNAGIMGSFLGGFIGAIYLGFGLLYYFPSKYLYDFSIYIKQAMIVDDQESMSYAFARLKLLFRFWGILMIVFLSIYAIILFFAIMASVFASIV